MSGVIALAIVSAGLATASPAMADKPNGSNFEILVGSGNAAVAKTSGTVTDAFGLYLAGAPDSHGGPATQLGCAASDKLDIAYTPSSADGSTERPQIAAGSYSSQVFTWTGLDSPLQAFSPGAQFRLSDYQQLSTKDETDAYYAAYAKYLEYQEQHPDAPDPDPANPEPTDPSRPFSQRWPAGSAISAVVYCTSGQTSDGYNIVSRGSDGRAISSWVQFRTKASTTDASKTSFAYDIVAPKVVPSVKLSGSLSGTSGTLTASLSKTAGALTDAAGTVTFYAGEDATGKTVGSSPVSSTGTASLALTGLTPGATTVYTAVYTPSGTASASYTAATSSPFALKAEKSATTVALTASSPTVGETTSALTAKVTAASGAVVADLTGSVEFSNAGSGSIVATVPVTSSGVAAASVTGLTAGSTSSYRARFVPAASESRYSTSAFSAAVAVTVPATPDQTSSPEPTPTPTPTPAPSSSQAPTPVATTAPVVTRPATKVVTKATLKLAKSKAVVKKTKVKATLSVTVPGSKVVPTGKVSITVNGKKVTTVKLTAKNKGKVTVTLPKFVKTGKKVKVVASYLGSSTLAAVSSKTVTLRVTAK